MESDRTPKTGGWTHFEIDTTTSKSGTGIDQVEVRIDGQPALAPVPVDSSAAFGAPTIRLGVVDLGTPAGNCSVLVDNVTFDTK